MKYLIIPIDEPEIIVTMTPPDPILIDYAQVIQSTGGGGGSNSRIFNFNQSDLNPDGTISFLHNLGLTRVDYSIFSPDFGEIEPVGDSYALNILTVDLSSWMPINGTWQILIEV